MADRPAWLDQAPPPGYVAGAGRGATGFTTRMDTGGFQPASTADGGAGASANASEDFSESRYDRFAGYSAPAAAPGQMYSREDAEADAMWASVDRLMANRTRHKKKNGQSNAAEKGEQGPKLQSQLADAKEALGTVTEAEWANLPDMELYSTRIRKRQKTSLGFMPVPDSLLERAARSERDMNASIDPVSASGTDGVSRGSQQGLLSALDARSDASGSLDVGGISSARKTVLSLKLQRAGDGVSGVVAEQNVDKAGYLTNLDVRSGAMTSRVAGGASSVAASAADAGDIKRTRTLLRSATRTNPHHPRGWIAAARLEDAAAKLGAARKIIMEGTAHCPDSEEIWVEAAKLHTPAQARGILAQAVARLPRSVRLWTTAAAVETEVNAKRRTFQRALECIPNSVTLWRAAVELEDDPRDARILLQRAVECVPASVEMWLALARLETEIAASAARAAAAASTEDLHTTSGFEEGVHAAKKVLNRARKATPTSREIWVAAAQLEESSAVHAGQGQAKIESRIRTIIQRMLKQLQKLQVVVTREQWLETARGCESNDALLTCAAIIYETIELGVEMEDRREIWVRDAAELSSAGYFGAARAVFKHALEAFPADRGLWRRAAELERRASSQARTPIPSAQVSTTPAAMLLKHATAVCPEAEELWLMRADEEMASGAGGPEALDRARRVLHEAFAANQKSERIWLAAAGLELTQTEAGGSRDMSRQLLSRAREACPTSVRVWKASIRIERLLAGGNEDGHERESRLLADALQKEVFAKVDTFWLMLGDVCIQQHKSGKSEDRNYLFEAREAYAQGLRRCPRSSKLWLQLAMLETQGSTHERATDADHAHPNFSKAQALLEKARQIITASADNSANSAPLRLDETHSDVAQRQQVAEIYTSDSRAKLWRASAVVEQLAASSSPSALTSTRVDLDATARAVIQRGLQDLPKSGLLWSTCIELEGRHGRKQRIVEALKACDSDPRVHIAVARTHWAAQAGVDIVRRWLGRSIAADPQFGDGWIFLYRFEKEQLQLLKLQQATDDSAEQNAEQTDSVGADAQSSAVVEQIAVLETVRDRCAEAGPVRGDLWKAAKRSYWFASGGKRDAGGILILGAEGSTVGPFAA